MTSQGHTGMIRTLEFWGLTSLHTDAVDSTQSMGGMVMEEYTKAEIATAERMEVTVEYVREFLETYMVECAQVSKENRRRIQAELLKEKTNG